MRIPEQLRCPYTRKPLAEIDGSREHIIPRSLGGADSFSVVADRQANNAMSALDKSLAQTPLMGLMRVALGVKGYRGSPKLTLPGKLSGHDVPIHATFAGEGVTTQVDKPAHIDPSGKTGWIIVPADQQDARLEKLRADHGKKGATVEVRTGTPLGSEVKLDLTFDVPLIKRATATIAFLAAFRMLGDDFLDDPLYAEWQRCIRSVDGNDLAKSTLRGTAFDGDCILPPITPEIGSHEHAVVVANFGGRLAVTVGLFGGRIHNMTIFASEPSTYGLRSGEGEVTICDAKTRRARSIALDWFPLAQVRSET